jgi:hypothetical protein
MTLEISIVDTVSVFDRFGEAIIQFFKRVLAVFANNDEEETTEVAPEADPDRGPPDLGVAVGEDVGTGEALS